MLLPLLYPGVKGSELLVANGPTLYVDIGFDPAYTPATARTPPAQGITGIRALVDTGATESCIDNLLGAQLNLPIVDRRNISGSTGKHMVDMYLAQIQSPR